MTRITASLVVLLAAGFVVMSGLVNQERQQKTAVVFRVPASCTTAANEAAAVIAADNRRERLVAREVDAAWHGRQLRLFVPAKDPRTPDLTSCGETR